MPDGDTPGLVVGCGEKWNTSILVNEELGRFGIGGGIDGGVHDKIGG